MKIKVNRLPRVKLADLLDTHGFEMVVSENSPHKFYAELDGIRRNERGQFGGFHLCPVTGYGASAYEAVTKFCSNASGAILMAQHDDGVTEIGRIELIPPDASEIEEVP